MSIFGTRRCWPRPLTHAQVDKAQGLVGVILALPLPSPGFSPPRWLLRPGGWSDLLLPPPSPPSLPLHLPSPIEHLNSFPVSWDYGRETARVVVIPKCYMILVESLPSLDLRFPMDCPPPIPSPQIPTHLHAKHPGMLWLAESEARRI